MKETPEEQAARTLQQMRDTARRAGQHMAETAIGEHVLLLLAKQEAVTAADLLAIFEKELAENEGGKSPGSAAWAGRAEAAIAKLRSLG